MMTSKETTREIKSIKVRYDGQEEIRYECPDCEMLYDDLDFAQRCCSPDEGYKDRETAKPTVTKGSLTVEELWLLLVEKLPGLGKTPDAVALEKAMAKAGYWGETRTYPWGEVQALFFNERVRGRKQEVAFAGMLARCQAAVLALCLEPRQELPGGRT